MCRAPEAKRDPFLPYEEALWVAHLSETHTLLLNKFNLLPHHTLVVTRAFEPQSDFLTERDLEATRAVLQQVLVSSSRGVRTPGVCLLARCCLAGWPGGRR